MILATIFLRYNQSPGSRFVAVRFAYERLSATALCVDLQGNCTTAYKNFFMKIVIILL
jgi:hypothetical protein